MAGEIRKGKQHNEPGPEKIECAGCTVGAVVHDRCFCTGLFNRSSQRNGNDD